MMVSQGGCTGKPAYPAGADLIKKLHYVRIL
jgi:hypothetical protein